MKKLILSVAVAAFTLGAFAGEACCPAEKAATAAAKKTNATTCAATAQAACAGKAATAGCSMAQGKCAHVAAKKVQSPKAAAQS